MKVRHAKLRGELREGRESFGGGSHFLKRFESKARAEQGLQVVGHRSMPVFDRDAAPRNDLGALRQVLVDFDVHGISLLVLMPRAGKRSHERVQIRDHETAVRDQNATHLANRAAEVGDVDKAEVGDDQVLASGGDRKVLCTGKQRAGGSRATSKKGERGVQRNGKRSALGEHSRKAAIAAAHVENASPLDFSAEFEHELVEHAYAIGVFFDPVEPCLGGAIPADRFVHAFYYLVSGRRSKGMDENFALRKSMEIPGLQIERALQGLDPNLFGKQPTEVDMSVDDTLAHLCEAYSAFLASRAGKEFEWGSKTYPTEHSALLLTWKDLRAHAVESALSAKDEDGIEKALDYIALHDAYHVGKLCSLRMRLEPGWDAHAIYG